MELPKSTLINSQFKKFEKVFFEHNQPRIIIVTVRHDDSCGNGHNTFSISGEIWRARKTKDGTYVKSGRDCISCGQITEDIAKHVSKLKPYLKWHLCSTDGPLHYVDNATYLAKKHDLDAARRVAIWPDAELEDFTEEKLKTRLSGLMAEFKAAVESFGFTY